MGNEHSQNHVKQNKQQLSDAKSNNSSTDELKSIDMISRVMPPNNISPTISTSISNNSIKSPTKHRRRSSLIVVNNGITGKLISSKICKIAASFWHNNVENLPMQEQLEIGVSIFFDMLSANAEMKHIMIYHSLNQNKEIEKQSLKFLDMMGWYIRQLVTANTNLNDRLRTLGELHNKMGIRIRHYTQMLASMHETFSYYFATSYNIEIKYAIDEIFAFAAHIMTGNSLKCNAHLSYITQQFQNNDIPFLKNLKVCLNDPIGRDYFYTFLSQTFCDEMVIFLQSLSRFKHLVLSERFFVAREITKISINQNATFSLNLSYETRNNATLRMAQKEQQFANKDELCIPTDFFSEVETEVYQLITRNHWNKFIRKIKTLQLKSFNVD